MNGLRYGWVSISLLRFLSLIALPYFSAIGLVQVFQSHSWDSYRWSWKDAHGNRFRITEGFNLTLEILIVDRPRNCIFNHNKTGFNLTLEILIVDRTAQSQRGTNKHMFQSHSWDSYRWSLSLWSTSQLTRFRFNLTLEILIVDRRNQFPRVQRLIDSFNLTLEILIVDRPSVDGHPWRPDFVSISLLRFLSLIVFITSITTVFDFRCFNLTLEILIVDR